MRRATLAALLIVSMLATTVAQQRPVSSSCQSDIVSATVVATFCGHQQQDQEILDLLILWRARPGWFHWTGSGRRGSGGSRIAGDRKGFVSETRSYGDMTVTFAADFDKGVATIAQSMITLDGVNTIVVDRTDDNWRISNTRWTDPALPLAGDWNLALAKRSPELVRDLQCDVLMPPPPVPQLPVVTGCDRLKQR